MPQGKSKKKPSVKEATPGAPLWRDDQWTVRSGKLKRARGNPGKIQSIFRYVGEKLPKAALSSVAAELKDSDCEGVYFAHDSMGCARYAGRGNVFTRLKSHFKAHPDELVYFSFYLIKNKKHEREIETALIRIAGHLLSFNERKKRASIESGDVKDYEPGTKYFERHRKKGRKRKARRGRPQKARR